MPSILESRQRSAASDLQDVVKEIEQYLSRDDADTTANEYTALRESREAAEATLADLTASLNARRLAQTPVQPTAAGEPISEFRRILREYDRGNSEKVEIPYLTLRELTTSDPYFRPNPSRIAVEDLPVVTPALDSVAQVQVGPYYDFVVPPPVTAASTVAEGAKKPTVPWVSTKVSGSLGVDALIIDVSRQTLEDDASAENTLRKWLSDGVRLRQNAKVAAAIAGATGTQTASGTTLLGAIRAGKAKLSALGILATAVHIHPDDAAIADMDAMNAGHTGPEGLSTYWGMTVVENPAVTVNNPLVGALKQAAYFLYKGTVSTYLTDSGATDEATPRQRFNNNLIGLLGEGRSDVKVVQPALLVKCTKTP